MKYELRVWASTDAENCDVFFPVKSVEEAITVIKTLFHAANTSRSIESFNCGLEHAVYYTVEGGRLCVEWAPWHNQFGETIGQIIKGDTFKDRNDENDNS